MSLVKKTVNITQPQEDWVRAQIKKGDYGNDSELFRDLIRKEQERAEELATVRAALSIGEMSGVSQRTPQDIKEAVLADLRANGQLPSH
jgi:antitoxin ParD1/3/4